MEQERYNFRKHPSYKGEVKGPLDYPIIEKLNFKKFNDDRALEFTFQLKWKNEMKKKYGDNYKQVMKKEKLYN